MGTNILNRICAVLLWTLSDIHLRGHLPLPESVVTAVVIITRRIVLSVERGFIWCIYIQASSDWEKVQFDNPKRCGSPPSDSEVSQIIMRQYATTLFKSLPVLRIRDWRVLAPGLSTKDAGLHVRAHGSQWALRIKGSFFWQQGCKPYRRCLSCVEGHWTDKQQSARSPCDLYPVSKISLSLKGHVMWMLWFWKFRAEFNAP